jgi:hypothetical protein
MSAFEILASDNFADDEDVIELKGGEPTISIRGIRYRKLNLDLAGYRYFSQQHSQ